MQTAITIFVVDDLEDQRDLIVATLLPAPTDHFLDETRAALVRQVFKIRTFESAKEAELMLGTLPDHELPDLFISDNNFQWAKDPDEFDRAPDRGLYLLEHVHQNYPQIPLALVTLYELSPYIARFVQMAIQNEAAPIDVANALYAVRRNEIDGGERFVNVLQRIARKKINLLSNADGAALYRLIQQNTPFGQLLQTQVTIEGRTYTLASLLGGWAEIVQVNGKAAIRYREGEALNFLQQLLPLPQQVFNGQLNTDLEGNETSEIVALKAVVAALKNQTVAINDAVQNLIIQVENMLITYWADDNPWRQIHNMEDFNEDSISAVRYYRRNSPFDKQIMPLLANNQLKIEADDPADTVNEKWENILRARLIFIAHKALQARGAFFRNIPFSFDFTAHVLFRDNPNGLLRELYRQHKKQQYDNPVPEILQPENPRETSRRVFISFLGLAGNWANVIFPGPVVTREDINPNCLYPLEQQWYQEILNGNRL